MEKRKQSTVKRFLNKKGLTKVPNGKEVDYKIPLKDGGTDTLRNLHLIKKSVHKEKTAREARKRTK
jgi:arginine repressor